MFKKLFSCLGETSQNEQVADLSNTDGLQPLNRRMQNTGAGGIKPEMHPESNINGQEINFESDGANPMLGLNPDMQNSNLLLQMQFLQQANLNKQQKYYYEQEDGEVESKITTASPSKTQYYKAQREDNNNPSSIMMGIPSEAQQNAQREGYSALSDFSPMHNISQPDFNISQFPGQQQQQQSIVTSMTEKKLNNYLQQAKYLMSNQPSTSQIQPANSTVQNQQQQPSTTSPYQEILPLKKSRQYLSNQKGTKNYSVDTGSGGFSATLTNNQSQMSGGGLLPIHMQNIYQLESCPSSKKLFNNNNLGEADEQKSAKNSFNTAQKRNEKKILLSQDKKRNSYTDKKPQINKSSNLHRKQESQKYTTSTPSSKDFYSSMRNNANLSELSGNKLYSNTKINSSLKKNVKNSNKKSTNQKNTIVDQFDSIILEEETAEQQYYHQEQQSEDQIGQYQQQQLRVLDYDDEGDGYGQQIDLGHIKSVNKRQTSKTEVFSPVGQRKKMGVVASSQLNKQPSLNQQISTKINISKGSTNIGGSHKKTISHVQLMQDKVSSHQQQPTRNTALSKKHMTTTTSPADPFTRTLQDQSKGSQRLLSGKNHSISLQKPTPSLGSPFKKLRNVNTMEIQEDYQNEDEEYKQHHETQQHPHFQLQQREFDIINQTISPSSSSKFQFQPKFFKPTNQPSLSVGRQSQSMEEPNLLHFSSIQQQQQQL